jgi:hypothetical protein
MALELILGYALRRSSQAKTALVVILYINTRQSANIRDKACELEEIYAGNPTKPARPNDSSLLQASQALQNPLAFAVSRLTR